MLLVSDDMIADLKVNKKLSPVVTESTVKRKKLNISSNFISQFYFLSTLNCYTKHNTSFSHQNT